MFGFLIASKINQKFNISCDCLETITEMPVSCQYLEKYKIKDS